MPRRQWYKSGEHIYGRSFARAIIAKKGIQLACLDIKIQIIYNGTVTIHLGEIDRPDTGLCFVGDHGIDNVRAPDSLFYARPVDHFLSRTHFAHGNDGVLCATTSRSV
jgi:hypothetical protein